MSILRNRFLNTVAFLSDPRDPAGGGDDQQEAGNDDAGDDTSTEGGQDDGAAESGASGDGEGDDGSDGESDDSSDGEDDDDLAGFTPEQREKIEARIARETNWRDKQLARLNAKKRSAEEDARAARTIAEGGRSGENLTPVQIEERAKVLASQMSAQERYDNDANAAYARGSEVYDKKWKSALDRLPNLGGVDLSDMQDILTTEKPHVVLYLLSDPETYERVMALPPARRRNEFVKLSLNEEPKPKTVQKESKRPGGAPPPVRPITNGRKIAAQQVDLYDDKVDDDAWYRARNENRRKKFSTHV